MYHKLLIDGIVRQTTILLAHISTSSGVRAPLARVADQVFFKLAQEIEAQGVTKAVVADMFGMALRTYQKKTRRLEQSATDTNRTLWEAVYAFIGEGDRTRQRVFERFRNDGEREVAAVLNDLVTSGLAFITGGGDTASYGVTSEHTRAFVQNSANIEALANVIWLNLFQGSAASQAELLDTLNVERSLLVSALQELLDTGRITGNEQRYEASNVVIPLGDKGKEAAMLDHFRAVAHVLAARVQPLVTDSTEGGATFVFSVFEGHPYADQVRALYSQHRRAVAALWDKVSEYNRTIALEREQADRVTFYLGQVTEARDPEDSIAAHSNLTEVAS